ncbi:MAG: hypothetical protein DWI21_17200 [Planctomycetota bacterium]|nr:MAG: hypothetical protein DWI21_17200 [Planctomycetota bacterium]GDY10651.1 hypothetical protein LBMAG52_41390 [Planctomycetia bacterium]
MRMRSSVSSLLSLILLLGSLAESASAKVLEGTVEGKAPLKRIDVIEFAPENVLLIGDGTGSQIIAVQTNDKASAAALPAKIENLNEKLAAKVGAKAEGIELLDMAVNPNSGRVYFALRKQDDKSYLILTLSAGGEIGLLDLDHVTYSRVMLPKKESAISRVTDVTWVDGRLVAAATANEEFASKIFVATAPLKHEASGELHSAETYHVSHRKWETRAPMTVILPYRENGKSYVVGAFACTPVVKYPLDDLLPDAKVKGSSMIELGSGNRPLDMFLYEKDGKEYVLSNTFRFHHERKPFGPSPYWTVKFESGLLAESENINEKAINRLKGDADATPRIQLVESFHGVMQMDRLGANQVVVLRTVDGKRVDFEVLPLP